MIVCNLTRMQLLKANLKLDKLNINEKDRLAALNARLEEIKINFQRISVEEIKNLKYIFTDLKIYSGYGPTTRRKIEKRLLANTENWFKDLNVDKLMRILRTNLVEDEIKRKKFNQYSVSQIESRITSRKTQLQSLIAKGNNVDFFTSILGGKNKELTDRYELIRNLPIWIEEDNKQLILARERERNTKELAELIDIAKEFNNEILVIDKEIAKIKSDAFQRNKASILDAKLSKAAKVDNKIREDVQRIKTKIHATELCPYCSDPLTKEKHLDHIYPVSKGGLNIKENLLYCCSKCNIIKSDKGLREFCRLRNINFIELVDRLERMGKHI
jgi:5-methylcytosine-specific restriction endonuclease McrA